MAMNMTLFLAHSTTLRESRESIKLLLDKIKYSEHDWLICGDYKMTNILLKMLVILQYITVQIVM